MTRRVSSEAKLQPGFEVPFAPSSRQFLYGMERDVRAGGSTSGQPEQSWIGRSGGVEADAASFVMTPAAVAPPRSGLLPGLARARAPRPVPSRPPRG
jgi:hypothetical protein